MNEQPEIWETVESKPVADCRVFRVREDFARNGEKQGSFFVLENPDWVNIVALTKEYNVVLIEQFRHGTQEIITEIPGGMIDEGETAEAAARRELLEETGYAAEEFILIGRSKPNPALQNNWIYHYAAVGAEKIEEVAFDEHESVVTKLCHVTEIPQKIKSGEISHSLVVAAFQYFSFFLMKV